jgi:hypothetical protein
MKEKGGGRPESGTERSEPEAKPKIGRRGDQIDWREATAA